MPIGHLGADQMGTYMCEYTQLISDMKCIYISVKVRLLTALALYMPVGQCYAVIGTGAGVLQHGLTHAFISRTAVTGIRLAHGHKRSRIHEVSTTQEEC